MCISVSVIAVLTALCGCGHLAAAQLSFFEYGSYVRETLSTVAPASAATSDAAGQPSTSTAPPPVDTTTLSKAQEDDCQEQIGKVENGVVINKMRKYDVAKVLEELGGAAGKLAVTRNMDVPEAPAAAAADTPLPDTTDKAFWVYDYRDSDFSSYVRYEHGLLRQKGTKDEYVDVRGELYWTPPDFCGKARHAKYRVDPHKVRSPGPRPGPVRPPLLTLSLSLTHTHTRTTSACTQGFVADVTLKYCGFHGPSSERSETMWCAWPAQCYTNATHQWCIA
ncbi:hypothetical protein ONE63_010640 [Megalurothrips usitatus]|uniref:Uncharacterized protein n=1 Tax=Megalurothrips usitatus TaxID=439358 RepID=A0AAV7XHB3_9NEOP|nr:hypothetical protein ONE63_010640 [Megalurothrips usitatus]